MRCRAEISRGQEPSDASAVRRLLGFDGGVCQLVEGAGHFAENRAAIDDAIAFGELRRFGIGDLDLTVGFPGEN